MTHRPAATALLTAAALLLTTAACSGTTAAPPQPAPNSITTVTPLPSAPPSPSPPPTLTTPTPSTLTGLQQVTRVFDGDTLYARLAGDDVPVRFIGINAPEVKHPNHPADDCLGPEARALARALLTGGVATLSYDRTQGDKDRYGRYLRYVNTAPPNQDVAITLISEGLAREYTYRKPYARQETYRAAEKDAQQHGKGGWAPVADGGCGWS